MAFLSYFYNLQQRDLLYVFFVLFCGAKIYAFMMKLIKMGFSGNDVNYRCII